MTNRYGGRHVKIIPMFFRSSLVPVRKKEKHGSCLGNLFSNNSIGKNTAEFCNNKVRRNNATQEFNMWYRPQQHDYRVQYSARR